ncbi:MAG: TonB-dependent receptor plug domain-containing protein [Mangrovibacterium sp.]
MKFSRTGTSGYSKKNSRLFLAALLFIIFHLSAFSQPFRFEFDNTPVPKALTQVAAKMNIKVAFDAGELQKYTISGRLSGADAGSIINAVIRNTGFSAEVKHDTWLIVKDKSEPLRKREELTISGFVFDGQSGEPLPYASVYCPEMNRALTTTIDGYFSMQADSAVNLQIRYLSYFPLDTAISKPDLNTRLVLRLIRKVQPIETVHVKGEKIRLVEFGGQASHFSFNPVRFADLPNYGETDIFRALQTMPGISSSENSSQLSIRGSSADQNLVLFDGFTLYNLDHFFGVFSALNPYVIQNIQVYRGGFDSKYGERVSGIVDITSKSGNRQKPVFYGGINLISANLTAEIPVSPEFTLVTAGRRAYSDIYSSWLTDAILSQKIGSAGSLPEQATAEIEPDFHFGDYNVRLTWRPGQDENLSFSLYGANDFLDNSSYSTNGDLTADTEDKNRWGNSGFGLSWKKQWNARHYSNLQTGHSGYFNSYYNNTVLSGPNPPPGQSEQETHLTNEKNDLSDYFVTLQHTYMLKKHQPEFGLAVKYNRYAFYKDAEDDFIYNDLSHSSVLYSGYFQDEWLITPAWKIKPGIRMNYYDKTGKAYPEPRFASNFRLKNNVTLKLATGRYYQFLNKSASEQTYGYNRDFWVLADGKTNPVISSNHYIAGVSYETARFFFDVEGYYKTAKGLQEYLFFQDPGERGSSGNTDPAPSRFISGTGTAAGIDFLIKYEIPDFTSWISYSVSKSRLNFEEVNEGKEIPSDYDQPHEIKWVMIYSLKRWNFSTLSLFQSGRPYVKSSEKEDDFTTTRVYSRLPDYFRVDCSANYNFLIGKVYVKPGLSILNVLNTKNYLDIYTRDFNSRDYHEATLIKAQKFTLNFFLDFQF